MIYTVSSRNTTINWDATDEERIVQNVLNLIRTRKREISFIPDAGLEPDNIDNLMSRIKQDIEYEVIKLIEDYEYRAEVLSVTVDLVTENGDMEIVVELEV